MPEIIARMRHWSLRRHIRSLRIIRSFDIIRVYVWLRTSQLHTTMLIGQNTFITVTCLTPGDNTLLLEVKRHFPELLVQFWYSRQLTTRSQLSNRQNTPRRLQILHILQMQLKIIAQTLRFQIRLTWITSPAMSATMPTHMMTIPG